MTENLYQAPSSELQAQDENREMDMARRRARWLASWVDSIVVGIPFWIILMIVAFTMTGSAEAFVNMFSINYIFVGVLYIALFSVINWRLLVSSGQTVGKLAVKNKIVDENGQVPDASVLLKRYAIFLVPGYIPFVGQLFSFVNFAFILGDEKRCLHDRFANTYVVKCD